MSERSITVEQKLRYLQEIENIHRLGKKAKPPQGKSWEQVADAALRRVLRMPLKEVSGHQLDVRPGALHHEHSPRSSRLIERTLKTNLIHADVLHSYRDNRTTHDGARKPHYDLEMPRPDEKRAVVSTQHGSTDLHYPAGHLQGYGFVPGQHQVNSHVQLQQRSAPTMQTAVPTSSKLPSASHYH